MAGYMGRGGLGGPWGAYLWARTWRHSRDGCSRACLHAVEREVMRGCPPAPLPLRPPRPHLPRHGPLKSASFHTSHTLGKADASPSPETSPSQLQRYIRPPMRHCSTDTGHTHLLTYPPSPATSAQDLAHPHLVAHQKSQVALVPPWVLSSTSGAPGQPSQINRRRR